MSDDRIQQGLDAYADQLQRSADVPPAAAIRQRATRRKRNRAAGAAFAAVLLAAVGLGTVLNRTPDRSPTPAAPTASSSPRVTSTVKSSLKQLRTLDIDLEEDVLIDVADDGVDLWMQIGANDTVDFTGAVQDDTTRMSLQPAPVTSPNRVVIAAVARPGYCVAATSQPPLALQPCQDGDKAQTWRLVPAGDSGQFQLEGEYGILKVDDKLVSTDHTGRTGLQTLRFDR